MSILFGPEDYNFEITDIPHENYLFGAKTLVKFKPKKPLSECEVESFQDCIFDMLYTDEHFYESDFLEFASNLDKDSTKAHLTKLGFTNA